MSDRCHFDSETPKQLRPESPPGKGLVSAEDRGRKEQHANELQEQYANECLNKSPAPRNHRADAFYMYNLDKPYMAT